MSRRAAYVFYVSENPGLDRQRVELPGGGCCFIRVVESRYRTALGALRHAKPPEPDEVGLMNTHVLTPWARGGPR